MLLLVKVSLITSPLCQPRQDLAESSKAELLRTSPYSSYVSRGIYRQYLSRVEDIPGKDTYAIVPCCQNANSFRTR